MRAAAFAMLMLSPAAAQAVIPIDLGSARPFGVVAGAAVTATGNTIIHGDVGVWPGVTTTGLVPGVSVTGLIHVGDAVAMQAHADAALAYAAAAGASCGHVLTGQDLGGLTLSPGVYCFASSAQLTGTLTLDGMNDPNAAFIFQIGSTLITATGAQVLLTNGATGDGTFFQVGSSATLGTNTAFAGSIAALASVTLTNGSSIHSGRALALNGTVALDSNDIDVSGLAIPVPEPTTWLSMMTGFGIAGMALRRRRSTPPAIACNALIGNP